MEITTLEASRMLGVSTRQVHRMIQRGELSYRKLNGLRGAYLLDKAQVEKKVKK